MATTVEVQAIVIDQMISLYRPPKAMTGPQQVEALRIYANHLTSFPVASLQAGWEILVRTHRTSMWPTVAEIIDAVTQAGGQAYQSDAPAKGTAGMVDYAKERAKDLMSVWKQSHPEQVELANRNGWIYDLKWVLEDEARLYAQYEWLITHGHQVRRKDGSIVQGLFPFDPPGAYAPRFNHPRPSATSGNLGKHLEAA